MQQRLYEITLFLVRQGQASAEELAQRFEVSKRTIYRDLDTLSAAGIPVWAQRGRGGGIRLMPGFVLDKALFTEEERQQLLSQLSGLTALGTPDSQAALDKLGALFGPSEPWLEVDFAPWSGGEALQNTFRILKDAILNRIVVAFSYVSSSGRLTRRLAEPTKILFRGQGWYLCAYSRERAAFRFFKLSRILHLSYTDERFEPRPAPAGLHPAIEEEAEAIDLELRFKKELAFRVYDEFSLSSIQTEEDGSFAVRLRLAPGNWLVGYLLSFGSGLTVQNPPALRKAVEEELARMCILYALK